jgi:hypothetical protein
MSETRFEASPDGRAFSFVAPARGQADLTAGEPARIRMLGLWLRQTGACPLGYDLVSRKTEERPIGGFNVYYTGRCRAEQGPTPS